MKLLIILLVTVFFVVGSLFAQEQDNQQKPIYSVKAEIKELKNRTLECRVRDHKVLLDQPKQFGADDKAPTPPEMLAISFGGCVASTIQFVAYQRKIDVKNIQVTVEGEIDFTTALGKCCSGRAGFSGLNVKVKFDSQMNSTEKKEFLDSVFKVGAVIDNVMNQTAIEYEIVD
jgi:uncharacterized OsmC-like protein